MAGAAVRVGTAGWSVPRASAHRCADSGSHLERYSRILSCVEINSCFYRSHGISTYRRWAAATPPGFRFAVKMPRAITHDRQLRGSGPDLRRFLDETSGLGKKRGPILVQLPASVVFDARVAGRFFRSLRELYSGAVVCEPRSPTWFGVAAERLLVNHQVARVAADPPRAAGAERPGGWAGLAYFRLHGSPRAYWSRYDAAYLEALARSIRSISVETWVVFDNTAGGHAFENAWELSEAVGGTRKPGLQPASGRRR
jgi:uncharacterized protein YecE (DUF72 family)